MTLHSMLHRQLFSVAVFRAHFAVRPIVFVENSEKNAERIKVCCSWKTISFW